MKNTIVSSRVKGPIASRILLCFLPLALVGCTVLTPTDPYAPRPDTEDDSKSFASSPVASTPSDPETVAVATLQGAVLSLDAALAIALANNPDLAATSHEATAARAREDGASGVRLPTLSAEGGYTHYLDDQRLVPATRNGEPGVFSDSIVSGDLVLRLPLFAGGAMINEARATELLSRAAAQRLHRTRDELVFNVTSVFNHLLAQEKFLASLETSRETLEGHLQRVNDLIEAQKAARVDRLRTEVRLADVEQKLVRETNTLAIQKHLLTVLMGIESADGTDFDPHGDLKTTRSLSFTMEEGVFLAFENRPDYRSARYDLEARAKRVDVARAGHSPRIGLFASYGGRYAYDPSERPSGADRLEDVGRAGIGLEIPLYRGGRVRARVREERANLSAAQERLRKLELQVRMEVEIAFRDLDSARVRIRTLEKAVEWAEEGLRIERQKYEVGKGSIVDVLDAQAALLESETNYYRALADLSIARARIDLSTGVNAQ